MPSSVARPDDGDVGDRAVGDPHLLSVQDPVGAVAARARAHRAGVRAGVGLGQPEAADRLAGGHPRQPLLLLLLRAPAVDRVHRQRALHRDEAAHAAVAGLELQAGQAVGGGAGAGAAVALAGACRARRACRARGASSRRDRRLLEPVADVRARPGRSRTRAPCRGCRAPRRRAAGRCRGSPGRIWRGCIAVIGAAACRARSSMI